MTIREMNYGDVDQVYAIECENFSQPWTKVSILAELESERAHYLVVEEKDKVLGYIGFWKIFDEAHVTNVAVEKLFQGKGLGSKLVGAMLSLGVGLGINSYTLEVRVGNHSAIALYEKYGFREAGRRKGFYDLPKEDALIMWRTEEE